MWALGVILFNLAFGKCPFRAENEKELYRKIARGAIVFPDEGLRTEEYKDLKVSASLKTLIRKLLSVNGDKRPTCSETLKDDWFKSQ